MIKNDRQYRSTKAAFQRFNEAFCRLERAEVPADWHPLRRKLELDALQSQAQELRQQVEEYDALKSGVAQPDALYSVADLPKVLIQARIARHLTQKDLADRLGVKEQQIQRYEANDYSGAGIDRLRDVAKVLDVSFTFNRYNRATLNDDRSTVKQIIAGLQSVGFDKAFVRKRLVGSASAASTRTIEIVSELVRVFGWSADKVLSGSFDLTVQPFAAASFKIPEGVSEPKLRAYTLYARFLALVALDATSHIKPKQTLPSAAPRLRELIESYGGLTFSAALETLWSCGIVVLPLADRGAFHGAFWKAAGRGVIVLKQSTHVSGRWLFDLLHETAHAVQANDSSDASVVDSDEEAVLQRYSESETWANDFAAAVLLRNNAEEIAQEAVAAAAGKIERLKGVVPKIARNHHVSTEALAFHLAYRLKAENNIDWWAAATNLAAPANDWSIARDRFLASANFSVLGDIDRRLLIRALQE